MLDRLDIRDKLNLLVVIPLVMAVLLLVPWLATGINQARTSQETALAAQLARTTSGAVQDLQQARLLAVAYLDSSAVPPNAFVVQLQQADAGLAGVRDAAQAAGRAQLAVAADHAGDLATLRTSVVARSVTSTVAVEWFAALVDGLVDQLALTRLRTVDSAETSTLGSLDALLRSNEASSRSGALLLSASARGGDRTVALQQVARFQNFAAAAGQQFGRQAPESAAQIFAGAVQGPTASRILDATNRIAALGTSAVPDALRAEVFASVRSSSALRQVVEGRISQDVAVTAEANARTDQLSVVGLGTVAGLLLVAVVALSVVVGRSVSQPLRRLTTAAGAVADLAQEELLRVADEDAEVSATPRLAAIEVRSSDEIGDLADAFNRVQATAALLLDRQVAGRRNVAAMFASVGRRTSNLVGRQLGLIDILERSEEDPDTLATLYRLDHVSTRLRRSASSLVVLSGSSETTSEGRPLALADALRAALGTIEEYQRVVLDQLPDVLLAPRAASDLVLLMAELVENAVLFSPPRTSVEVAASTTPDGGCLVSVVDHGMGMPAARLAEENARLQRRERLDLAPTDVLGLFVVGRIARRHGLAVHLEPTPEHGITAVVQLPPSLLVAAHGAGPTPLGSAALRGRQARATTPAMPAPVRPAPALPVPALPAPALAAPAAPADQVPVGFADGHDPGTLRRRDPGRAWAHERGVATGGEAPDGVAPVVRSTDGVAPSPAVLGVPRRVPGATLAEMVGEPGRHARPPDLHQPSPSVASPEQIDPEQARRDVEQVDAAVARARDGVRASVPRRVPGAALDGLHGLRGVRQTSAARDLDAEAVRRSLDEVDAAVERSRSVAAAQPSIADERAADERPADERPADGWHPPQAPDLPRRRVPGATLAALEDGGPRGGLSATPESPQAVLDWVNDLETAQPFAQEWADHDQENTDE